MGLFVKKIAEDNKPAYTLSLGKTLLVVGLGNPGKEYDGTRHNIGFAVLDAFAAANDFPEFMSKKDLKSSFSSLQMGENRVICIKPTTFMNFSGEAVRAVMDFYKISTDNLIVVHDELDIPFGQIRTRTGGSSAGHNGLKSLIQHLGEDFGRIRIGIRNDIAEKADSADFVLGKFDKDEKEQMPVLIREASNIVTEWIYGGQKLPAETRSIIAE